ncbi:MAG: helix-turn-helix domain-containing protein [Methanosphaera sp.]|nr:helix-turn-helix domain-containing protein [Methanobrevibacter sp.]MBQ6754208.1 helix-turn-helix domain-containing protein [Bacteroidales bacterium]MBR0351349.1 helix-turn-helix domain-containing protein [Clostridia bacterium]MBR0473233.1 helix-turn-helix domain-containing protein [Methanosphaera sp.]
MNELTETQKRVYYIIKDFIEQKGYSPSFRELAKLNGNNSVATMQFHLRNLRDKGYIDYTDKLSRTIIILK